MKFRTVDISSAALKLPISVKAVMAATENMPDGNAYKPGDVIVKTLAGLSVEIDNTDAEGRLTLADAIEYAKRRGAHPGNRSGDPDRLSARIRRRRHGRCLRQQPVPAG